MDILSDNRYCITLFIFQAFDDCLNSERHRKILISSFFFVLLGLIGLAVRFFQVKLLFINLINKISTFLSSIPLLPYRDQN
jgi:hypothetical protein